MTSIPETPLTPGAPPVSPQEGWSSVVARAINLSKVYGAGPYAVRALDDVSVDFMRGQLTAIMGPSGSGKSTLMHCLAALDRPSSGEVQVDNMMLSKLNDRQLTTLRRDHIGFVFQGFNLIPTLSAVENMTLPLSIAGRKANRSWFEVVIQAVGLGKRLRHRPNQLSGGQQQRVASARALMSRPTIIFADEPTGNLDSKSSADILNFLRRCVDHFGQSIVMVTHDPVAASFADRVLFLADGKIVGEMFEPTADHVLDLMKNLERLPGMPRG